MSLNGQIQNKIYQREVFEPARLSNPNRTLDFTKTAGHKTSPGSITLSQNRVPANAVLVTPRIVVT